MPKEVEELESIIADIDTRLKARDFLQVIGIGAQDLKIPTEELHYMPLDKLSKGDLARLKNLLEMRREKILQQIDLQTKLEEKMQTMLINRDQELKTKNLVQKYNQDPNEFFAKVLLARPIVAHNEKSIYDSADKIIAISNQFTVDTDPAKVIFAWEIVAAARDITVNEKYINGAQQMFEKLITVLPAGMQGLKFLYDAKAYPQVDSYLFRPANEQIQEKLINDVHKANLVLVEKTLTQMQKFIKLPLAVQQQLIEQQAYVNKLNFDLSYIKDGDKFSALINLKSCAKLILDNINRVIDNYELFKNFQQTYTELRQQIAQHAAELLDKMPPANTTLLPNIGDGLGGLAWLNGFGAVAAKASKNKSVARL